MRTNPPVFLDIHRIRFPITAIVSILHRISGVILFLFVPFALYLLDQAMASAASFDHLKYWLHTPHMLFGIWVMLSVTAYHTLAGLRHLIMDCGFWETLQAACWTSYVLIVLALISMLLLGVWLW